MQQLYTTTPALHAYLARKPLTKRAEHLARLAALPAPFTMQQAIAAEFYSGLWLEMRYLAPVAKG